MVSAYSYSLRSTPVIWIRTRDIHNNLHIPLTHAHAPNDA